MNGRKKASASPFFKWKHTMPKSIQISNTEIKRTSARERERERRGGWRGAVWSYAVISILCILWWYFFGVSFSAFGIVLSHVCSSVLVYSEIQHQPQEVWCFLLLVDWARAHLNAPTNKQPQPIHFFCSFFRRASYRIHFQFFSLLFTRLFVSFSILFLAHLRCDEMTLNAWLVIRSLLDFALCSSSHLLYYSQTDSEFTQA